MGFQGSVSPALVLPMSMHYHSPLATHFGVGPMTAMIIDASGMRPASEALEVGKQVAAGRFFWLDISGGDASARPAFLTEAGLNAADAAWALRFGQAGRMHIGGGGLRAVTWIADRAGNIIELHLIGREKCITTLWGGDPAALDDIRRQFAERLGGFENNLYEAAGIPLQLLLGTLGSALSALPPKADIDRWRRQVCFVGVWRAPSWQEGWSVRTCVRPA